MAVVLSLHWAGVTPEQYNKVSALIRLEEDPPQGMVLHVARFEGGALLVTDVWNSQGDFERFFADRLAAAVKEAGLEGEPETGFVPLHRRVLAPGVSGAA